jgi:hypothetical protein
MFRPLAVLVAGGAIAGVAQAAVPSSMSIAGVVTTAAGQVAPDGDYFLTFQLHSAEKGGNLLWKEAPQIVPSKGGQFQALLGAETPLPAAALAGGEVWLAVSVGSDPELVRKPLRSVAFALRAAMAESLACTACVGSEQLDPKVLAVFAKTGDLASYAKLVDLAKVATSGSYADLTGSPDLSGFAKTASLAKVATSGSYADLAGLPTQVKLGAACGTGLVMRGVLADGSYDCVALGPPPATATTLGGVMVGSHLTVDGKGVLAVKDGDFLALAGGTLAGDLSLGKNQLKAARVDNLAQAPVCDAGNAGGLYFDTVQKIFFGCDGAKWVPLSNTALGSQTNPASSCKAILDSGAAALSGTYWLTANGQSYQTACDMTTDGGGWTYVATVAMGDAHNWKHSTPIPNTWESTSTFGSLDLTANADFKSLAWTSVGGKALMLTYKNTFLLRTDGNCLADTSLRAKLAGLGWDSTGSQDYTSHPASTHPCVVAAVTAVSGEKALVHGGNPSRLYLKAGEADGAQDSNKDRAYLSTSIRTNVDVPRGLGAFNSGACASPNCENDVGGFNADGSGNDIAVPGPGGDFYGIWVR